MSRPIQHVAVIGAGPAGSVAAIRLARLGHRVTLIEKATFPRDKVCGECVSALGIAVLDRIGAADAVRSAGPKVLRRATAVAADGSSVTVDLPRPMWGVTRRAMDALLVDVAASLGVDVRRETTADLAGMAVPPTIHGRDARATKLRTRDRAGEVREIEADVVLLADGRGRALGPVEATGDLGIKTHFRHVDAPRDAIELIALPSVGGYAGLAAVNDGLWNAAWSVPAAAVRAAGGDLERVFREACAADPVLRRRFRDARRVGAWLACPLPRYAVRRDWPAGVIPIGNAAAAVEPVGGEGMGLAMRSGEMAADAIDAAARDQRRLDTVALRRAFDGLWRTRRTACRAAAVALAHPLFGPIVAQAASRFPMLGRAGMSLAGK